MTPARRTVRRVRHDVGPILVGRQYWPYFSQPTIQVQPPTRVSLGVVFVLLIMVAALAASITAVLQ